MPFARNRGARLHYEVEGEGEPVALIPGLGMTAESWRDARERLEGAHRVIAVDPRGAGGSDRGDVEYTGELVAADLAAVLDAEDASRAHVVGMSMGGMIAQELALRHPARVRSLVLASTYAATDEWSSRIFEARRRIIVELGLSEQFRLSIPLVFSPGSFRAMRDWIAVLEQRLHDDPPDPQAYLRQLEFCMRHDATDRLGRVVAPTLVVTGERDILTSPLQGRELAELIPGAEYREEPDASHALIWERGPTFAELVATFVKRHPIGRRSPDPGGAPVDAQGDR